MRRLKIFCTIAVLSFFSGIAPSKNKIIFPDRAPSVSAVHYNSATLRSWLKLTCYLAKETRGFTPPHVARVFGYCSINAYQSVVYGIKNAPSLTGQLEGFSEIDFPQPEPNAVYNWEIVSNYSNAELLRLLFEKRISKENLERIRRLETRIASDTESAESTPTIQNSKAFGIKIARAVFEYSKTDGAHEAYLNPMDSPYVATTGIDKWIATDSKNGFPLAPKWGSTRSFISTDITMSAPPPPPIFSTDTGSVFYKSAFAVYQQVKQNSTENIRTAQYWADDPLHTCTPTGHTFNILTQLLEENKFNLAESARAYMLLGIAENDAFIACWRAKYQYNLIRPVSYIRNYIDANFKTTILTPPFPSYTSGHATEAGAACRIFSFLFDKSAAQYAVTDRSQIEFGHAARSYKSFEAMAQECALSRFYGGIHYPFDNEAGLDMGKKIGDNVVKTLKPVVFD